MLLFNEWLIPLSAGKNLSQWEVFITVEYYSTSTFMSLNTVKLDLLEVFS